MWVHRVCLYMSIIYDYHMWVSYMSTLKCVRIWLSYVCHTCVKYDLVYDYHMRVTHVIHQILIYQHFELFGKKSSNRYMILTGDSSLDIACLRVYEDFSTYMSISFCTYMRFRTYMILIYEYSRIWYSHMIQFPDGMYLVVCHRLIK